MIGHDTEAVFPTQVGVFLPEILGKGRIVVFPTQVGVFPTRNAVGEVGGGLPHAGGGVSA